MLLVVGLGNPGPEHVRNRHNIGFMAVDAISARYRLPSFRSKFQGEIAEGDIAGNRVLLLKPMTYMNESGRSVGAAAKFYKAAPGDVIVFHDELDLASGKVRVKIGGGAAGHNGIRSIAQHLGPDFRRVRLGIGHPGDKGRVLGHVLDDFSKIETKDWVEPLLAAVADHFPLLAAGRESDFMSKVAGALRPPRPKAGAAQRKKSESGDDGI